ncbi:hypothetical protein HGP28_03505 [Vibrio sp. SM6]|uniref:Uncharacterized protein n=1 Tax=Vibrio agarilyticus TaxID=2726741 RepID=A0A7X8TNZ9_9VIBR|nr:hypothetical protein [Vibrio agarilyticus]NLS11956.1 hypothetical protein [Vibrio agarilyticus]
MKKALITARKGLKPGKLKPKLTPEQLQQKAKMIDTLSKVIDDIEPMSALSKESQKLLMVLAKTFIQQAPQKINEANAHLLAVSGAPDQSDDQAT